MTLNLNLRGKLLVTVTIGLAVAFSIFGSFRIHMAEKEITAEMMRADQDRVTLIADSIAPMIAGKNLRNIEAVAQRIVETNDVNHIKILDRNGKILINHTSDDHDSNTKLLTYTAPMMFSGAKIGSVELLVSMKRLDNALHANYVNIFTIMPFFLIFFGVLIYTITSALIVKPLTRLSKAADQLAQGDFATVLPAASNDELGNLVRAFSSMRESRKYVELELYNLTASLDATVAERVAELRDKDIYVHAVLENVNEGIIVIGEGGEIVSFNHAAEKIFGYRADEVIQQNFSMLISAANPDLSGKYQKYSEAKAMESIFGVTREAIGLRKNKSPFPLELKTSQINIEGKVLFITTARDISERKDAEKRINYMASHDTLTGLPNRALLQDRIEQALAHNRRRDQMAAVLFIDLDKFKDINDTLGHAAGDLLLKEVAKRLLSEVRSEDTVARQGGDEFIILLSKILHPQEAGALAQKLLDTLLKPFSIKGQELHVSASIGISVFPDDGNELGTLLQNSDIAMYHAKDTGRSNYQYFSAQMNEQAAERQALTNDLRHAIARDELSLVYQPVVDMASGEISGMEVLLRWQHPVHGLISPTRFIPLAEESGLILTIGDWVLNAACTQLQAWQQQGYEVPRLAINLSAKQFRQHHLAENIEALLLEKGVASRYIGIEITESMLVQNIEEVVETLLKLSKLGLEISIDDFGTGYSSLSYLKRFPINKLKIDKSFVDDITNQPDDAAIIKAIIAMAHGLSMKVVSEGVETQAQHDFLRKHGCEQFQGFLYSVPLAANEMEVRFTPLALVV